MDVNFIPSKTPLIRAKVQILSSSMRRIRPPKSLARASLAAPPELRTTLATSLARARKPSRPLSLHRPPEPMMTRPRLRGRGPPLQQGDADGRRAGVRPILHGGRPVAVVAVRAAALLAVEPQDHAVRVLVFGDEAELPLAGSNHAVALHMAVLCWGAHVVDLLCGVVVCVLEPLVGVCVVLLVGVIPCVCRRVQDELSIADADAD